MLELAVEEPTDVEEEELWKSNRAGKKTPLRNALVGFHSTKSVSHIAKLSSSQAGQGHGSGHLCFARATAV